MARRPEAGKVRDDRGAARNARRLTMERLIDETVAQSFWPTSLARTSPRVIRGREVIGALLEQEEGEPGRS